MLQFERRKFVSRIICLIAMAAPLPAAVLCVNPTGIGGCAKTIGAAVAAAAPGDYITVAPGTYKESVTIDKPLILIGADEKTTIIDATGLPNGIYINGIDNPNLANVGIAEFTVQNAKYEGVLAANVTTVTISDLLVTGNNKALTFGAGAPSCPGIFAYETGEDFDCGEGIHLTGVTNSLVLSNTVQGNAGGILLSDDTGPTSGNTLLGNTVSDNPFDCGITLASHPPAAFTKATTPFGVFGNNVIGNTASRNGLKGEGAGVGIFASGPGSKAHHNRVINNVLTGNDLPGVTIHGHTPGQNLDSNLIVNNTISGNGPDTDEAATPGTAGIAITSVSPVNDSIIAFNTISGQDIGVAFNSPGGLAVGRNNLMLNGVGVYNLGTGAVNAENNYWGCGSGPLGLGANGCSTVRAGGVTVRTWATTPFKQQ
jgi:parallel beta-helix repeat protein